MELRVCITVAGIQSHYLGEIFHGPPLVADIEAGQTSIV